VTHNGRIAVVDLGGQYCHLITRRLRDFATDSDIFPPTTPAQVLSCYAGIILSGGPQSVYDADAPTVDERLLELGVPILGICYGHQLLAKLLGGQVSRQAGEYGFAQLKTAGLGPTRSQRTELVETDEASWPSLSQPSTKHPDHLTSQGENPLFRGTPPLQQVWMSHSDAVVGLPPNVMTLAMTERCACAAFAHSSKSIYGLQFHPEVAHTEFGSRILENFVRHICRIKARDGGGSPIPILCERIRQAVAGRSVFFLVSGGVDSTVAFTLCGRALPKEQLLGLYVDSGLMRQGETEELRANLAAVGLVDRLRIWDASATFLKALAGKIEPEEKRQIIGRLFVEIQAQAMKQFGIDPEHWLLGQGTIYPDTIESGGDTRRAALIKTHHNRCDEIRELIRQGKVIEPLAELYKDEVRQLGRELGLPTKLTNRWPFPGPGLAIRCLCSRVESVASPLTGEISADLAREGIRGALLPLRTVGVQGDARTYRMVIALQQAERALDYQLLRHFSSKLCNDSTIANRIIWLIGRARPLSSARIVPASITAERIELLRQADFVVRSEVEQANLAHTVWQFPVVLVPIGFDGGESVILRPVNSVDGMTANFAALPSSLLYRLSDRLRELPGIDAVFLDITNKPPATIEWE
jgi:GMP synthase (glutamine-hydrolysing)